MQSPMDGKVTYFIFKIQANILWGNTFVSILCAVKLAIYEVPILACILQSKQIMLPSIFNIVLRNSNKMRKPQKYMETSENDRFSNFPDGAKRLW